MLSLRTAGRLFQKSNEPSKFSLHTSTHYSRGALLEAIQNKFENFVKYQRRRRSYKEAEKAARDTLDSQLSAPKEIPSVKETADASHQMSNNMTSPRSWRIDNAGAVREEKAANQE